mmetsp:Transcript_80614/g.224327  ORF Transcript_80614/g.224327 Transcript_80614/m.224327 type:complete len:208 (+) Transcript_80614:110-733(+)
MHRPHGPAVSPSPVQAHNMHMEPLNPISPRPDTHQYQVQQANGIGMVPVGKEYQDQIMYGCRLIQDACSRKVTDMQKEVDALRQEINDYRKQAETLRERNNQLEADVSEKKRKSQEQLDMNRSIIEQAAALRAQLARLGKFRDMLGEAFTTFDTDGSGSLDRTEYGRARQQLGLSQDFNAVDADHNNRISAQEFASAAAAKYNKPML